MMTMMTTTTKEDFADMRLIITTGFDDFCVFIC